MVDLRMRAYAALVAVLAMIWRYKLVPVVSLLPERMLRWLDRHWQVAYDPADGWTFWLDASYHKWCRKDKRRNG